MLRRVISLQAECVLEKHDVSALYHQIISSPSDDVTYTHCAPFLVQFHTPAMTSALINE